MGPCEPMHSKADVMRNNEPWAPAVSHGSWINDLLISRLSLRMRTLPIEWKYIEILPPPAPVVH